MSYLHLPNLYKDQTVLMFRQLYSMEKIHGTSAHLTWKQAAGTLHLSPGGGSAKVFEGMFDIPVLKEQFQNLVGKDCTIYGEYYGGGGQAGQKMSATYGKVAKFIVFDVQIMGANTEGQPQKCWLSVPQAHAFATSLGLEFVHYDEIEATIEAINATRDADSVQAIRNGCGPGHKREGVVLRPLVELTKNNGDRVIAKHRRPEFSERLNGEPPPNVDPAQLKVLEEAQAIATEWVVPRRLEHVLPKLDPPAVALQDTRRVIQAMTEDVLREAAGEIVESKEALAAIGRKTAELFHLHLKGQA
jgi:hypothetical protein